MPNALSLLGTQLREIWKHFGLNQKVSTIAGLVLVLAAIGALLYWSARTDYQLLYSGLSLKDAASVREKLSDEKIAFELKDSGRAIYVPDGDVYRARLMLAAEGLPKDASTGFELFEQPKFGLTDFAQQINYQRALQGELERTIGAMTGIEAARVMLVLPKDKLFASDEEKQASASILLTLSGGASLSPGQVQSIAQLVSGSVPGLQAAAITITDQRGALLSRPSGSPSDPSEIAGGQLSAQENVETQLTKKAQDMLDKSLGAGRSIVKVSATLDFSNVEKRSEKYNPEGRVVRSESIQSESSSTPAPGGGGVAGAVANMPVGSPASATIEIEMSKTKKENIKTDYAIPNDVELTTVKGGRVERLSVSVCVAKGEQARSEADLKKIERMVRGCVGLVDVGARQDTIQVSEMEFAPPDAVPGTPWYLALPIYWGSVGRGLMAGLLVFIIYKLSRKMIAGLVVRREDAGVPVHALTEEYGEEGASRRALDGEAPVGPDAELNEIVRIARDNPKAIAAWISSIAKAS